MTVGSSVKWWDWMPVDEWAGMSVDDWVDESALRDFESAGNWAF